MKTLRVTDLKQPARVVNFATILPTVTSTVTQRLVPLRDQSAATHLVRSTARTAIAENQRANPRRGRRMNLLQLPTKRFAVSRSSGYISRAFEVTDLTTIGVAELDLPPGAPRFVN